jgi:hypothetical protein
MKRVIFGYRLLYVMVLLVFLANILKALRFDGTMEALAVLLLVSCAISSMGLMLLVLFYPKGTSRLVAAGSLLWCGLFTWFAWWSPTSPFRSHEFYSFDPSENAAAAQHHLFLASMVFGILVIWFASVALVLASGRPGLRPTT